MKKIFLVIVIIVLVVLFGTFPLSIIGKIFKYIGKGIEWLANTLNFFIGILFYTKKAALKKATLRNEDLPKICPGHSSLWNLLQCGSVN